MILRTTSDVIDALGGVAALARMTGVSNPGVYNWRAGRQFPADTYLLIKAELKALGHDAPDHLWPMRQAKKAARR